MPTLGASGANKEPHPARVASEKLIGRDAELAAIDLAIDRVASGHPCGLAFVGEPGVGKTALLGQVCSRARAAGLTVVAGRGTEFERGVPFGVLVDALDATLASRGANWPNELTEERLACLASVFPSLAELRSPTSELPSLEEHRFHKAVRTALEAMANDEPFVLALDDVHWSDRASADLLAHLLHQGMRGPILTVIAYRAAEAPTVLRRAVAGAARDRDVVELSIAPLDEEQADELLGGDLPAERRRELYRETGGNPFYLMELARAEAYAEVGANVADSPAELRPDEVPTAIRAAIEHEVEARSPGARALTEAAAVVGEPFEPEVAGHVAQLGTDDLPSALDEIAAAGLIRPADGARGYVFRHPIVRRAVYESLGVGSRASAHGRAAEFLEHARGPLPARAHHVERSARRGDAQAIDLLQTAAAATAPLAPSAASRWLSSALDLLPGDATAERRISLLIPLATTSAGAGKLLAGRAALVDALPSLSGKDEVGPHAELVSSLARLDHAVGREQDVRAVLEDALRESEALTAQQELRLLVDLAVSCWLGDDPHALASGARSARRLAAEIDDRVSYATLCALEALACGRTGELDLALARTKEASGLVDRLTDAGFAARIEGLLLLGHAELAIGVPAAAARRLERGLRIARATNQVAWSALLTSELALARALGGELNGASEAADEALAASSLDHPELEIRVLSVRATVHTVAGDLNRAIGYGEQAVAITDRVPRSAFTWTAHSALARARLESGDPALARDDILAHAGGAELPVVPHGERAHWFAKLAEAELSVEDVEQAGTWTKLAEEAADAYPLGRARGEAHLARARLELAEGRVGEAAAHAREAADAFRSCGLPIDSAKAEIVEGRGAARAGDHESAIGLLRGAEMELRRCGADRNADEAASELRALGERVSRRARPLAGTETLEILSRREREVAGLVARGLTNREIAAHLFLSTKTIETHLSRAYEKLGISSRAALAVAIERAPAEPGERVR